MRKSRSTRHSEILERAKAGALFGGALGILAIGVGVLRALLVILGGRTMAPLGMGDVFFALSYLGGFTLAGAVVGGLWPLRRSWIGAFAVGYLGAGIVSVVIAGLVLKMEGESDPRMFVGVAGLMTLAFGTFLAIKVKREP